MVVQEGYTFLCGKKSFFEAFLSSQAAFEEAFYA
jgi:hypothetical protein